MDFAFEHIYHLYNRGNNSQKVFFARENYLFFLEKLRKHILPHADLLAWCLMPNHFHLMISVNRVEVEISEHDFDPMTLAHRINNQDGNITHPMNSSHRMSRKEPAKYRV